MTPEIEKALETADAVVETDAALYVVGPESRYKHVLSVPAAKADIIKIHTNHSQTQLAVRTALAAPTASFAEIARFLGVSVSLLSRAAKDHQLRCPCCGALRRG